MMEWLAGVLKDVGLEFLKWAAVGLLTWAAAKLPTVRSGLSRVSIKAGAVFWIALAIAFAGFVSSAASIVYTSYRFQALANYGSGPASSPDINVNGGTGPVDVSCPDGYYVVAAQFGGNSAKGDCIGCFNSAQLTCRKIVK
jgi:hypothetical protein